MRIIILISCLSLIDVIQTRPQQLGVEIPVETSLRTEPKKNGLKDTMEVVSKQLVQSNITDFTRDTRTPPRIKLLPKIKKPAKAEIEEISHPGVAEPIDVEKFLETTVQPEVQTTTDSGLSTWILLSGNSPSTKPPRKASLKPVAAPVATVKFVEKTTKFPPKPKATTTRKPTTTTIKTTTSTTTTKKPTTVKIETTSQIPQTTKQTTKIMTKVKASILNSALTSKTKPPATSPNTKTTPVTTPTEKTTTPKATTTVEATESTTETNDLKPEAKIVDLELIESRATTKRPPKRPQNNNTNANKKKKKTPNRRRKPEDQKTKNNSTKVATKEKPISTQFYNYLSREVMPTVGVGLVGLVVTAGLASYFLFPFTGLRRNYEGALDRKDDHIYDNYFSDGELEQDVIGKMIEGGYEYSSMSNSVYQPYHYDYKYDDRIIAERQKETGYTVDGNKYVVGNIPDSFVPVTPAVVPEHGPRSFPERQKTSLSNEKENKQKFVVGSIPEGYIPPGVPEHSPRNLRIRRDVQETTTIPPKDQENEVTSYKEKFNKYKLTKYAEIAALKKNASTESSTTEKNESATVSHHEEPNNIFSFLRNIFEMKIRIGLNFLLNTTDTFSKYLKGVQERVETVIKENRQRHKVTN